MEFGVRIVGFLLLIIDWLTRPLFWLMSPSPPPSPALPPLTNPLLLSSATHLAQLIRDKRATSEQVVQQFIERVQQVNPQLNAVVEERFLAAREEARKVDQLLAQGDTRDICRRKPLLGVPLTVKESCSLTGLSLSGGSLSRLGQKSPQDGAAVSLLRSAGAIPLLVSNTPELCLGWESSNHITGRTSNPYCLNRTAGGSSGGEAALIASGASVIGVASDIAGSIRVPAMFNGIFGHKPTSGIVPIAGHYPTSTDPCFAKYLTVGPLTRYAEDLQLMLTIMAGDNAHKLQLDKPVDLKTIKVSYMFEAGKSFVMIPVDKSITKAMKRAIRYLDQECGAKVQEVNIPEFSDSVEISVSVFFGMQDIPNLLQHENNPKRQKSLYAEILKTLFGVGMYTLHALGFYLLQWTNLFIPRSSYKDYYQQAEQLRQKIELTLGQDGVLLYPTFPIPAFYHNQVFTKTAGVLYTMLFNILGLPSTHVPLGLDSNGLPIGMQVIAASHQDRLCLAVAKELEKGLGGWRNPAAT